MDMSEETALKLARDYAKLCGWELTEPGWRRVHEADLTKAFMGFASDIASRLHASEKRASEAERTFADLRNLIEKSLVVMADLVRERDQLLKDDAATFATMEADLIEARSARIEAQSERDEAVRRAETAESELGCRNGELIIARAALAAIDRERDEAVRRAEEASAERTLILAALTRANQRVIDVAAQRDEARAALGKVVEALKEPRPETMRAFLDAYNAEPTGSGFGNAVDAGLDAAFAEVLVRTAALTHAALTHTVKSDG